MANSKQVWAFLDWHVFQCYPIFVRKASKVPLGIQKLGVSYIILLLVCTKYEYVHLSLEKQVLLDPVIPKPLLRRCLS